MMLLIRGGVLVDGARSAPGRRLARPLCVVHHSSAAGLAEARERGVHMLAETCPQSLFLTDRDLRRPVDEAIDFMCTPPLREAADREASWAALADATPGWGRYVSRLRSD